MSQPITAEKSAALVQLAYLAALEHAFAWGVSLRDITEVTAEPTEHGFRASVRARRFGCFEVSDFTEEHASPFTALGELADKARAAGRGA